MNIINTANYYMNIIIFSTILIVAILAALLYYFIKVKKITAAEERINYEYFDRRSAMEYCKFDDIVSDDSTRALAGAGMIVMNENIFITGIDVVGYNYDHASAGEKQRTMMNSIAFASIIEEPIQLRQTVEAVDIQFNIDQFTQARDQLARELIELRQQYQDIALQSDSRKEDPDVMDIIIGNLEQLDRKIASTEWKIREAEEVIAYEKLLQESANSINRVNQVMFSYQYNPDEFSEDLTREEIYIKAMNALKSKISIYSRSLGNCGCSCRPLEAVQLVELIRRHLHPNTADLVDVSDLISTEIDTLFVSSDSLYELELERLGETAYFAVNEEAQAVINEQINAADAIREEELLRLEDEADGYMGQILQEGVFV